MAFERMGLAMGALALVAGAGSARAGPAAAPGMATTPDHAVKRPAFDLRLRPLTAVVQSTAIVAGDSQLRHRLIGSMIDYFPARRAGFFVSGGGQLASRASIARNVNSSLARLLYAPGIGGLRASNRVAPAATTGYVEGIGRRMELRVEGGALLGRLNATPSGVSSTTGPANAALVDRQSHAVNPVMRASFAVRF